MEYTLPEWVKKLHTESYKRFAKEVITDSKGCDLMWINPTESLARTMAQIFFDKGKQPS